MNDVTECLTSGMSLRKLQENAPNSLTTFERYLDLLLFGDDEDIPSQVSFSNLFKFQGRGGTIY